MIPLYRGELHKVSGVPRQWTVPKSQIPLSVFRNALKKRNAALNEFLQTSRQNMDANASPLANGSGQPSSLASEHANGELEKRDGPENDGERGTEKRAENGFGLSEGKSAGRKERAEEECERRQERKRKREEDNRQESGRCIDELEDFAKKDVGDLEAACSKGKSRLCPAIPEPMNVDTVDQRVTMDYEVQDVGSVPIDFDETVYEVVRVRVSETGTSSQTESKEVCDPGLRDASDAKLEDLGNIRRNEEAVQLEATATAVSNFEETKSPQIQVPITTEENSRDDRGAEVAKMRGISETARKEELEAKLERLRAEKHRFVIRLKQVLHEEEMKKRGSFTSGSPASLSGAAPGPYDMTVMSVPGEKRGFVGLQTSADLEDGELEYARTPSPPLRTVPNIHGGLSSHSSLGPPSLVTASGRQTSVSHHLSQGATGRGGYYASGISPPSAAPGVSGGGSLSPGASFIGSLPPSLSTRSFSHSLALQHAAAIHAQKVSSVAHGHGQFSPIPPSGPPGGAIAGGPPGFGGYPISSSLHSHHSHVSQSTSSSLPHIVGQQGVGSSSLLATPRGPPGYHDIRLGGSTWIQR